VTHAAAARPEGGQPRLSFVVPLHDEAGNVGPLWSELRAVAAALGVPWEAVLVDDGSADGTREELRDLRGGAELRVLRLSRRYGQSAALQAGFDAARGEIVVSLDGDLQNDPADVPRLLAELDRGFDVVCGWRRRRRDAWLGRRLPSALANRIIGALTGVRLHDHGCTLRAYRRSALRQLRLYGDMHRFVAPWLAIAGASWSEIEVGHRSRQRGRSKYGLSRAWKVSFDLVALVALQRFGARPGRGLARAALPFLLLAAACLAAGAAQLGRAAPGPAPMMLPATAFLFGFAGAHLLLLAVLAELVLRWASRDEQMVGAPGAAEPAP
jgi:hypothetical protein